MKCKDCEYCVYHGRGFAGGYQCEHPKIKECAEKYEKKTNKRMTKACWYIGFKLIKTSLRYCPYKMEENENEV